MATGSAMLPSRVLLVECNNMNKWVGTTMPYEMHVPPLGLMYLASCLRKELPGVEVRIVESSLDCSSDEAFLEILKEFQPDVIGMRSIAFFLEELQRIARLAATHSKARLIVGGPIVKAYKEHLFSEVPELQIAVQGEGEMALVEVLHAKEPGTVTGLLVRQGDQVLETAPRTDSANIDSLPIPDYDLIDSGVYQKQLSYAYNHRRQGVLLTSRGCVYRCTYCFSHWQGIRLRSAENIFREIEELYTRHEIRDFYIVDDIFNVNPQRAFELFDRIRTAGFRLRLYFVNGLRADIATEEFVDRAIEAGAIWFTYAVESATEEIQRLVHKHLNLEKARHIIAYTQHQDVAVNISTMYGFPTETRAMAQRTLDWLGDLPKPSLLPYHFCLRFFPGCEINQQAIEAGWDPERMGMTSRFSYNDMAMGTPTLSKHEMNDIQLEYHRRFGMSNPEAVAEAVRTLRRIGYEDTEILHMYSVLKRKMLHSVDELLPTGVH